MNSRLSQTIRKLISVWLPRPTRMSCIFRILKMHWMVAVVVVVVIELVLATWLSLCINGGD